MARLVILGGGISGYGSAILAKREGYDVFLSDRGVLSPKYRALLDEWQIAYEQGGHSEELILTADEVVKSPGIPDTVALVVKLREQGTPVISELEFAGRYLGDARTICITGSNGKTTTTSLIYHILQHAKYRVALGGNIGESFAYSVATERFDWYVLEISSFQLDGMYDFRADVSLLMNITPDHLDRYGYKFENYAASKMRIVQNQRAQQRFIYSQDDPTITSMLEARNDIEVTKQPFSKSHIESGLIHVTPQLTIETRKMQIAGLHNYYNAEAAALAALAAGVSPEVILEAIYSFAPVEHRLEPAGVIDGVTYINDSKATNVDSVWYALESMKQPVVWIAGGTDKGNDYEPLKAFAKDKVHTLICMGVDNRALIEAFTGVVERVVSTDSLEAAMSAACEAAVVGDAVLLSPACASFDLFNNYEHRGELFKAWVSQHK